MRIYTRAHAYTRIDTFTHTQKLSLNLKEMQNMSHLRVFASLRSLRAALLPGMAGSGKRQPGKPIEGAGRLLFPNARSFQPEVATLEERRDKGMKGVKMS